jgi:hypothetical protein
MFKPKTKSDPIPPVADFIENRISSASIPSPMIEIKGR